MNKHELQWIAGVIDAEGSIEMYKQIAKRKYCRVLTRKSRIRISTTDNTIIPRVASILGITYTGVDSYRKLISIHSRQCRELLLKITTYLYLKQPQAIILLRAMTIKNGNNTPYSKDEADHWNELYHKIRLLNMRGKEAPIDDYQRNHKFSWPWLAGLIDGDGTVTNTKFGPQGCTLKPVIKISLTNLKTIEYLSDKLNIKSLCSGSGKGNKRKTRAIRFMSNNIYNIAPKIIPFLTLKKERVELALEIVKLRREIPNGQYNHPNVQKVKELLQQINKLNNTKN